MSERFPGGLITKTPVTPSGPYETSTASGIWTLDQQAAYAKQGIWPTAGRLVPDLQFNYVTMLLHGDGTNGAQNNTFLDSSTNNSTITRNGNTTQGSFSPYGSNWSNYFDVGSRGRLTWTFPSSAVQNAVSGTNYTLEFWAFRLPRSGTYQCIFSTENDRNNFFIDSSDNLLVTSNGGTSMYTLAANTYIPVNTWTHVALVCSGTTWTLYFNGVSAGTYSGASKTNYGSGTAQLGGRNDMDGCGYLSNFRVSTTARYSGAFTPSTIPFVADGSTAMLTCQSNRFIDTSTNNQALTPAGSPSVQRFNPFGTATAYSTSVIGGSGYFDGTGDYLITPSVTLSGDFTVEGWINQRSTAQNSPLITIGTDLLNTGTLTLYSSTGGQFLWIVNNSISAGGATPPGTWNHLALVRSGSTITAYLNGVSQGSSTVTTTMSGPVEIGAAVYSSSRGFGAGYASDVRINTTALYTSNFTPPTAPLTAVSGTSLLANMTNGAIFDNAMMNDLETVGNAQISTSVVKYGTGSMAFDGSGDWLTVPSSQNFAPGVGDWTIECWLYPISGNWAIVAGSNFYINNNSGTVYVGDASVDIIAVAPPSTGVWTHIAVTKSGSTVRLFYDGTQVGSSTTALSTAITTSMVVGGRPSSSISTNGYIDELRITKGYARYTTNFTPPTQAFPNIGPN
jgi:hypothetical protein